MPKIVNHDQRRKNIAQAAIEVIAIKGLESTKLTDIGRLAGVTTGAITHYFNDKDAVLMAALEIANDIMLERMSQVTQKTEYSLFEILSKALPTSSKSRQAMAVWLAFWSRSIPEGKVAQQQITFHQRWHGFVKEQLMHHFTITKKPIPENIDDISEGLTAQINGLIIRGLVETSDWPKERQHTMLKNYLHALKLLT
ncbi:MAG: TetR/AcrR family bet gene transcriptional repressor [Oleiphilaceae bacterium]|jgi:TetR/AcrR family transcriptional repressor of bet genes